MFGPLIGEVFGTFILILLGDGVVANVGLAPRLAAPAYNWNTITIGWAFAVIVAVYVSAGVSGAHLNPAVTICPGHQTRLLLGQRSSLHPGPDGWRFPRRSRRLPWSTVTALSWRVCRMFGHRPRLDLWQRLLGQRMGIDNMGHLQRPDRHHHRNLRHGGPDVGHPGQRRLQEHRPDAQHGPVPGRRHRSGSWSEPGRPHGLCHQSCP